MTHLRKMMLEELQRRNYSEETIRSYMHAVEDFSRRFNCSPDRLGPRHIRQYQAELFQKRKLSSGTVVTRLAALRFFYTKTLKKGLEHRRDSVSEKGPIACQRSSARKKLRNSSMRPPLPSIALC